MIRIPHAKEARPSALGSIAGKRCPRCRMGLLFPTIFRMNNYCSVCGLDFDRGEQGYFTGATFISYGLAVMLMALITLTEAVLFPERTFLRMLTESSILIIPLFPWMWQYSRILWMMFDQTIDPVDRGSASLGPLGGSAFWQEQMARGKVRVSTDHRGGPRVGRGDGES